MLRFFALCITKNCEINRIKLSWSNYIGLVCENLVLAVMLEYSILNIWSKMYITLKYYKHISLWHWGALQLTWTKITFKFHIQINNGCLWELPGMVCAAVHSLTVQSVHFIVVPLLNWKVNIIWKTTKWVHLKLVSYCFVFWMA